MSLLPKNIALFSSFGVMSETEMRSREEILFENYAKVVNIEALTMLQMAMRDYIPAIESYLSELALAASRKFSVCPSIDLTLETDLVTRLSDLNGRIYALASRLKSAEEAASRLPDGPVRADRYASEILPMMAELRSAVDEAETLTATNHWPFPTYGDMMFR